MEYATEVLDWLKKQAEVAADRYKRCPAGDPSSFTHSAEAKVFSRIVEQLVPLVHPAFVADCGSAPANAVLKDDQERPELATAQAQVAAESNKLAGDKRVTSADLAKPMLAKYYD